MFAGIGDDDTIEPLKDEKDPLDFDDTKTLDLDETKAEDGLSKLDDSVASTSQMNDNVTSTSNDLATPTKATYKRGRAKAAKCRSRQNSESTSREISPKRKKVRTFSYISI